jgi:hypothetical protein
LIFGHNLGGTGGAGIHAAIHLANAAALAAAVLQQRSMAVN